MKLLKIELFKLKRKYYVLQLLLMVVFQIVWTLVALSKSDITNQWWPDALKFVSSLNGLILVIIVARLWDMEHKADTLNILLISELSKSQLYFYKYWVANLLLLLVPLCQVGLLGLFALSQAKTILPIRTILHYVAGIQMTTMSLVAIHQLVSSCIKNQAFSICLGLIGGFIGLISDFIPRIVQYTLPWFYYSLLAPAQLDFSGGYYQTVYQPYDTTATLVLIISTYIIYIIGKRRYLQCS